MEFKPTNSSPFAPSPEAAEDNQPHQINFTPVPRSQPPSAATPARRAAGAARRAGESRPTGGEADRIDVTAARDGPSPFAPDPEAAEESQYPQIDFTPVPRQRVRRNGWTPARQRMFIAALAGCGSVTRADRAVGMTARSAYRLMDADGADRFAAAWDEAIETGIERVLAGALERALHGAPVALFRRGKLVRVEQRRNDRLAIALLGGRDRGVDVYRRSAVSRREYYQELRAYDAAKAEADTAKAAAAAHTKAIADEHRALRQSIRAAARRARRNRTPAVEPRVRTL